MSTHSCGTCSEDVHRRCAPFFQLFKGAVALRWFFDYSNLSCIQNKDFKFFYFGPNLVELGKFYPDFFVVYRLLLLRWIFFSVTQEKVFNLFFLSHNAIAHSIFSWYFPCKVVRHCSKCRFLSVYSWFIWHIRRRRDM